MKNKKTIKLVNASVGDLIAVRDKQIAIISPDIDMMCCWHCGNFNSSALILDINITDDSFFACCELLLSCGHKRTCVSNANVVFAIK